MHAEILRHRETLAALCRRHGVARLDVFGSAARGMDFDPARSDVDLLVEFAPSTPRRLAALLDFEAEAGRVLARPVEVVDRRAIEESENYIRRRRILAEAEALFVA
ncbi:MAG: nucleotidyltransferase domain-containing protein [Acetobacteraceae bacterium]|jgi:predicted nucleotidyltransferase|nr:nucleotidyltransferase domain-containing protein [Acetobacteraceae bacterium]